MFRYLGFLWDIHRESGASAAEMFAHRVSELAGGWRRVFDRSGMSVFCAGHGEAGMRSHALADGSGIILGALFEHPGAEPSGTTPKTVVLHDERSQAIATTDVQKLITKYWGNYVAFLSEDGTQNKIVLKDPCGSLPCYVTSQRDVTIFFSAIEDCVALGLRFTVNLNFLRARMTSFQTYNGLSSLSEVQHVSRGEAVRVKGGGDTRQQIARRTLWNPQQFSENPSRFDDPSYCAGVLRAMTRACTHAWASGHNKVVARLSGGLDSSVVVGCLAQSPSTPRITTYTYFNPRGRSDERRWASMAARHSRTEHIECPLDPVQCHLEDMLHMQRTIAPVWGFQYLERTPVEEEIAYKRGATAVFTGEGGDSGFCSDSFMHSATDYLTHHGVRPRVVKIAAQIARRTESTVWRVLARSVTRWLRDNGSTAGPESIIEACQLVNPDVISDALRNSQPHPWFQASNLESERASLRVGQLTDMPEFYDPLRRASDALPVVISPLYSQPLIETLLSIPLYVHFHEGRERGLARLAFKQEVPEEILRRQWKDRAPGFFDELVRGNRSFLQEMLLDGVLMQQNLLKRDAVEEALSAAQSRAQYLPAEIMKHLDTEIWARHWISQNNRASLAAA